MSKWQSVFLVLIISEMSIGDLFADWQGGIAKIKITPEQLMPMSGYASRGAEHSKGTLHDLWAKSLVMQDDEGHTAVLVTLDLIGLDRELSLSIRKAIAGKHQLNLSQIALNTSHTHTGPVVARNLRPMHYMLLGEPDQKLVDDYADFLETAVISVVDQAFDHLAPAQFSWGSSSATFAANRRNNNQDQLPALRADGHVKGPQDHSVPVLLMRKNDQLQGIVFGYACHCTTLDSFEWSGDYAGFAQIDLEETYRGAVAMFWAGCGADQNPLPRRTVALAQRYGSQLAHAVTQVVEGEERPISGSLVSTYFEAALPFATLPTKEQLNAQAASANKYEASRAKFHLERIENGETLSQTYPYPVQLWQLGEEVKWFFLGGEVVVDYAIKLKGRYGDEQFNENNVWCAGYSNDVMAYIPSLRVLLEGGYEGGGAMVYYGLPAVWSELAEETIFMAVERLAADK